MVDSKPIILTKEAVREQFEEVLSAERHSAELRAKFSHLASYLRLIGNGDWVPVEAAKSALPRKSGKARAFGGTWTSEILRILENEENGLEPSAIKAELAQGTMADRLISTPNAYHAVVNQLVSRQEVARYKNRLFTKGNLEAFLGKVSRGDVQDLPDVAPTVLDVLCNYVFDHPGTTARQVIAAMEGRMNKQAVYNNLSKAVRKQRIRRQGGTYFPANQNNPASPPR